MFKKLLFTVLALLCAYNIAVVAYRILEPKPEAAVTDGSELDYDTLKQYILSGGENTTHYLFFYSMYDTDSIYVRQNLLPAVEKDTAITIATAIEIVDVSDLDRYENMASLESDWGIFSIPAFAAVTVTEGKVDVLDVLEEEDTFTADDLLNWIERNEISGSISENN